MYRTNQEVFDAAVAGLAGQAFQVAFDSMNGCMYRAEDGNKCAVGHLIPDTIYHEDMEFQRVDCMIERFPQVGELFGPDVDMQFLQDLQKAHDTVGDDMDSGGNYDVDDDYIDPKDNFDAPAALRLNLQDIASSYNLTMPKVLTPRLGA